MSVIVSLHKNQNKTLAVVCDKQLVGKYFSEGELQLDLRSNFYNGETFDDDHVGDIIRNADMIQLIGEESIAIGMREGIIDTTIIKKVQSIPHANAVLLH